MRAIHFVSAIAAILIVFCTRSLAADAPTSSRPPNVVFLLTDDLGTGDVGCYGGKLVPTPNIDKIAAEGTKFTQYYSASPICSPSRAGLITGQFPARWNITSYMQTRAKNRECEQADFLDAAAPSLPRQLKAAGYATAHFGKWHLGGGRDVTDAPRFAAYGYDEHAGTYESPEPDPDITGGDWIFSDKDKFKRWERTGFFVDKTLDFLKRQKAAGKPAFVNLWTDDPHTPWIPRANAPKGETKPNLSGVLKELDRQVGRLTAGLKELGLEQDTILIFASDNGPLPTFMRSRAAGMRAGKLSLYEGGTRLPFIIRWPSHAPAGGVDDKTILSALDVLPTVCAAAGAKLPDGYKGDGQDMTAAWNGKSLERAAPLFWEYGRNDTSFNYPKVGDRSPNVAVRDGNWKLLVNADGNGAELYDVVADKNEEKNVIADHADVAKRMKEMALAWRAGLPKLAK